MEFYERLRQLRKINRVSQADIASELGVAQSVYARYETGDNKPAYDNLLKIADYFGVTTDYLLGRTKHKHAIILEGDKLPDELKGLDIQFEVIQKIAGSGLSAKQIERALKLYRLYESEYGDDGNSTKK